MEQSAEKSLNPQFSQIRHQVTEIQMIYQHKVRAKDRPLIQTSCDAYQCFKQLWSPQIGLLEECHLLLQDRSGRVMGHTLISKGSFHTTLVDPKVIYACALKARASTIILAHNHPSGNLKPSFHDIKITNKLLEAGKILDLPINDHLILSPEGGYFSFLDEGLMVNPPY